MLQPEVVLDPQSLSQERVLLKETELPFHSFLFPGPPHFGGKGDSGAALEPALLLLPGRRNCETQILGDPPLVG